MLLHLLLKSRIRVVNVLLPDLCSHLHEQSSLSDWLNELRFVHDVLAVSLFEYLDIVVGSGGIFASLETLFGDVVLGVNGDCESVAKLP
jgi:hypothetical protein